MYTFWEFHLSGDYLYWPRSVHLMYTRIKGGLPLPEWKHTHLLLTPGLVKAIDQWRKKKEILPDRNQAIRHLLGKALKSEGIDVQEDDESGRSEE